MTEPAAILRYFNYDHLPDPSVMRETSSLCYNLAHVMAERIPDGPERTAGLRKLLEAQDCFVRASLPR